MRLSEFIAGLRGSCVPGLHGTFERFPVLSETIPGRCPGCGMSSGLPLRIALNCMIEAQWTQDAIAGWLADNGFDHEEERA